MFSLIWCKNLNGTASMPLLQLSPSCLSAALWRNMDHFPTKLQSDMCMGTCHPVLMIASIYLSWEIWCCINANSETLMWSHKVSKSEMHAHACKMVKFFDECLYSQKFEWLWLKVSNFLPPKKTIKIVVKRTAMGKQLRFFLTMFSTSEWSIILDFTNSCLLKRVFECPSISSNDLKFRLEFLC